MHQLTRPSLVQIVAWCLIGPRPLSEPVMTYWQSGRREYIFMKYYWKFKSFHSRKCIYKYSLPNGSHFVFASMSFHSHTLNSLVFLQLGRDINYDSLWQELGQVGSWASCLIEYWIMGSRREIFQILEVVWDSNLVELIHKKMETNGSILSTLAEAKTPGHQYQFQTKIRRSLWTTLASYIEKRPTVKPLV